MPGEWVLVDPDGFIAARRSQENVTTLESYLCQPELKPAAEECSACNGKTPGVISTGSMADQNEVVTPA